MAKRAKKPKRPIVKFDPAKHDLKYKFEYNEEETKELKRMLRGKHAVDLNDLRRVALWKLDRVVDVPEVVMEQLRGLVEIEELQVDSPQSKKALTAIVQCPGVGFPMASAFLKFLRPGIFPIIDVRAYRALFGKRLYPSSYTLELYLKYAARVREVSREMDMDFPAVDEQLYRFDQVHNKEIDS